MITKTSMYINSTYRTCIIIFYTVVIIKNVFFSECKRRQQSPAFLNKYHEWNPYSHRYFPQVKFDLFEKIEVNGNNTHPLWAYLKKEQGGLLGNFIKWNFTKFIVNKEGKVVERHGPNVDPHKLKDSLEKYF